ncbi:MAG: hypothetical protein J7L15_03275 [Clostridiales bacterium]|nr:hypothetical protein [Clostridiales bacterium]
MMKRSSLNRLEKKLKTNTDESFTIFSPPNKNYYECRFMLGSKVEIAKVTDAMLGPAREKDFFLIIKYNYPELFL